MAIAREKRAPSESGPPGAAARRVGTGGAAPPRGWRSGAAAIVGGRPSDIDAPASSTLTRCEAHPKAPQPWSIARLSRAAMAAALRIGELTGVDLGHPVGGVGRAAEEVAARQLLAIGARGPSPVARWPSAGFTIACTAGSRS